jgi:putative oxidoreductase
MKTLDSVDPWGLLNKPGWIAFLRILLGILIVFKGLSLSFGIQVLIDSLSIPFGEFNVSNSESFLSQIFPGLQEVSGTMSAMLATFLSTYIIASHLIGGTLLVLGLFTRWTCLIVIPILLGAIIMVNVSKTLLLMTGNIELALSLTILMGLLFFFVTGAGANSIDELRRHRHQLENQVI